MTREPVAADLAAIELLPPGEAARLLGIDTGELARWADEGRLAYVRTPGGHRRYHKAQVEAIIYGPYRAAS